MSSRAPRRAFEVRHVQLARAVFAALAAVMITFSPDHSADVGLAVFSGFAIATGIVLLAAAWLVHPAGARWPAVLLGLAAVVAGMVGGLVGLRSTALFFGTVIAWAVVSGVVETIAGWRGRRDAAAAPAARDGVVVGILTLLLAAGLSLVPTQYALQYRVAEAQQTFTLTGITIGVGVFGAYAALVAVYLAIAAFSPRATTAPGAPSGARAEAPSVARAEASDDGRIA